MASGPGGKGPDAGDLVGRAEGARAAGWLAPGLTALQPPREDEAGGVDRSALSSGVLRRRRSAVARSLLRLTWLVLGPAAYLGLAVFARGWLADRAPSAYGAAPSAYGAARRSPRPRGTRSGPPLPRPGASRRG